MHFISSIRGKIAIAICVGAIALFAAGAWTFVNFVTASGADLEKKALQSVAATAAAALESGEVAKLIGTGQDVNAPAFRTVRKELRRVHDAISGIRFVYLVGQRHGRLMFLADAESMHSRDYSPPGQIYSEAPQKFRQVFATRAPAIAGPYRDRWGEWTSGLAPVIDPQTKQAIAVIGVDMPAVAWRREVARYRFFAVTVAALSGAVFALFAFGVFTERRARKRIGKLNAELVEKLDALELSNRIVENSSTIVFRIDLGDGWPLAYVSRNIDHYGYRAADLLKDPRSWRDLFHPDDRADIRADVERLASGAAERSRREVRFRRADGSWAWIDGRLSAVRDFAGRRAALEGIMFDITERKHAEEQIAHLATHDALTGLVNRAAFLERLQMAFAETKRNHALFAVHYIDIDHFKDINDAFGHEKGDLLLRSVAERLSQALRATDTVGRFSIARFGGDEFAILQTGVSEASDAAALAQRLNRILARPFEIGGNEIHITVSTGISLYDASIGDPNDMLMQADLALYRAKDAGRNQYHFHSADLDTEVRERVSISEDLHAAIENDQLELHYQPQVEIPSGRITGMEALIRWNHPTRGMVWPDHFIAVAEKTGMINMLGEWVMRRACRQIAEWRADGISPPRVGVNVSAVQLQKPEQFLSLVNDALRQTGIESAVLELELTESALVETTKSHSDILERLRRLGLRIAVDDFGTGYSSLQYLHSHPIGRIKIAQQFMGEVTGPGSDAAIVRAIIQLGRALRLDVIAEGVETLEQAEFLQEAGCNQVQGYYFSAPIGAGAMAELLRKGAFDYPRKIERRKSVAA